MASTFTMAEYKEVERALAHVEARRGFMIHAVVTLVVWAIVIPVNVFLTSEFPWSAFVVAGMSIGLAAHYLFGVRLVDRSLTTHQHTVEDLAMKRHAA